MTYTLTRCPYCARDDLKLRTARLPKHVRPGGVLCPGSHRSPDDRPEGLCRVCAAPTKRGREGTYLLTCSKACQRTSAKRGLVKFMKKPPAWTAAETRLGAKVIQGMIEGMR